jgi:SAM-dependent methyltransferase
MAEATRRPCPSCGHANVAQKLKTPTYDAFLCRHCGLAFASGLQPEGSQFHDYWWTKEFTDSFDAYVGQARDSLEEKLNRAKLLAPSAPPFRSMLDVGCGNGAYLAAGDAIGLMSMGTDLDSTGVSFAKSRGLRAFEGPIEKYEPACTFDFIHVKGTLHLVSDVSGFASRLAELTNSRGILYIDSIHQDGLGSAFRKLTSRSGKSPRYGQLHPPYCNRAFNRRSLRFLLKKAGYAPLSLFTFSRGDKVYYPAPSGTFRNPLVLRMLDIFGIGGLLGCYAQLAPPLSDVN